MIHEDTIVNINRIKDTKKKVRRGKESSNHKEKFSELMKGENNPNCSKLNDIDAGEVLWLKQNTNMKQKDIAEAYEVSPSLVSSVGKSRWLSVQPIRPIWYSESGLEVQHVYN